MQETYPLQSPQNTNPQFQPFDSNKTHLRALELSVRRAGDDGKVRRPPENAVDNAVEKARDDEDEDGVITQHQNPKPQTARRAQDPLQQQRDREKNVEHHGLHRIESHVAAEAGVSDDAEVESEEGYEAGVGDRSVEAHEREEGLEDEAERGVLGEEEAAVLDAVEEGEEVSGG